MKPTKLTQTRVRDVLSYDQETGVFVWLMTLSQRKPAGTIANSVGGNGYHRICIDGERHHASRIAWLYMTGHWPECDVEHKDLNPLNTRWENLRLATRSQNLANRHGWGKSGVKGAYRHRGKFISWITIDGKSRYLGLFDTAEDAGAAYAKAAAVAFGDFSRIV